MILRILLRYSLIVIIAMVAGYGVLTVWDAVTDTEASTMADSMQLAKYHAAGIDLALGEVGKIAEVDDLDALIDLWTPRYEDAHLAYVKFEAAIGVAKTSAVDYFAVQHALTERINDDSQRAQYKEHDERNQALYAAWETQADAALIQAEDILVQLDDMDIILQKLDLQQEIAFDTSLAALPTAISELSTYLSDFQAASEAIRVSTRSPFEVQ